MAKYTPQTLAALRGTGIARALRTLTLLEQQGVARATGLPWRNAIIKEFKSLGTKQAAELYNVAKSVREAIALTQADRFSRAATGAVIPTIQGIDFPTQARGRIRYQLWVELRTPYGKGSKYTHFNIYSNVPLGFDTLLNRASEQLNERMDASPGLGMGVRATAQVSNIRIESILSR